MKSYPFLLNILLMCMFLVIVQTIHASQVNFNVSPGLLEVAAQTGKTVPLKINITNNSDHSFFKFDILVLEKNGSLLPYSIAKNTIKIKYKGDNETIFIRKNETKELEFELIVDMLSAEKDYYYIIEILQVDNPSLYNNNNLFIDAIIQIPILLTVSENGSTQEGLLIHSCEVTPEGFIDNIFYQYFHIIDSNSKPTINCLLENVGKNRFYLSTTINYDNQFGQKGSNHLKDSTLLSGHFYRFSNDSLTNIIQEDPDKLKINHWLIGKYALNVIFTNPISQKQWSSKNTFLALPLNFGAISLAMFFSAMFIHKRRKN